MSTRLELRTWIDDYISKNKCRRCEGTGSTGSPPWSYTCDDCRGTGIDYFAMCREPSFEEFFKKIREALAFPHVVKNITIEYERKLAISHVLFGKLDDEWLDIILRR